MRDLEQVQRAERAATALERAWLHWRVRHGLGTGQLPPVSSYVGYSVEEPWGQPRVVFGLEAEEAERLAAILDGQDYVGPVHAEVAWADRRRQDAPRPWSLDGTGAGVPQQAANPDAARPRASDTRASDTRASDTRASDTRASDSRGSELGAGDNRASDGRTSDSRASDSGASDDRLCGDRGSHDRASDDWAGSAQFAAAPLERPPAPPDDLTADQPIMPAALRQAAAMADLPAELPPSTAAQLQDLTARPPGRKSLVALRARPANAATSPSAGQSALSAELPAPDESRTSAGSIEIADSPSRADSVGRAESASRADSPDAADSSGRAEPGSAAESSPPVVPVVPAGAVAASGGPASVPDAVTATRQFEEPAPWWQGTPFEQTAARVAEAAETQTADQVAMARLFPASRLNRSHKPAPGAPQPGPWPAGGKAAAGAD